MCHEVDNIVNQDAVRYVEKQVHTMGESMKKFCSDVQDLIPPIVDPVSCEAQAVALKANVAVSTYIKSRIGLEENHGHASCIKQSLVEPSDFDTVKNQPSNKLSGNHLVNQSNTQSSGLSLEGEKSDLAPGKIDDVSPSNELSGHHLVNQSNTSTSVESLEGAESDSALKIDEVSPIIELCVNQLLQSNTPTSGESLKGEESDSASIKTDDVSTNGNSGLSMEEIAMKDKSNAPEAFELVAPHEKEMLLSSEFAGSNCDLVPVSLPEFSPATSFHGEEFQAHQKVEIVCYSPADDSDSLSDDSSAVTLPEMAFSVAPFCGSIFTEPRTLPENSFSDILAKVVTYGNHDNVAGLDSDNSNVLLSSMCAPIVPSNREVAEAGHTCSNSVLSLESTDFGMETIDVSDKVKLEDSCVIVDNSMLYEVSRRTHKLRLYKKKIQDAFTSKKKLSKEYVQLAIWYGDLDIEGSHDTLQGHLQSGTTVTLDSDFRMHHMHDSEWELL
ncbi:uncharacterized protein LOC110670300 isoform X2 [Hevea brasiliensis]|nr:uncharacterized protein LOC110670300 isoform X2 [Hevea brasiliensis]